MGWNDVERTWSAVSTVFINFYPIIYSLLTYHTRVPYKHCVKGNIKQAVNERD